MTGNTLSTLAYGGVLVLSLGLAWVRWTADPDPLSDDAVVLLQGQAEDLERVIWKDDDQEATVIRKTDAVGDYLWVEYTKWEVPTKSHEDHHEPPHPGDEPAPTEGEEQGPTPEGEAPVDGDAPEGADTPEPEPEPEPELVPDRRVFKAGDNGDKLWAALSPMLAIRKLENVPADKLETAGLTEPVTFLTIVRKGRETELEVGGEVYGTRDRYVRNKASGEIFLVDDETLRSLKYARTRLPDRTVIPWDKEAVASAMVTDAAGNSIEVEQKNRQDKAQAKWVSASDPESEDEQLKTWMDKAIKLKGTSYAKPDEMPENLVAQFTLTVRTEKGESDQLEVLKDEDSGDYYGRSAHTRGLVKLLKGTTGSLADDVGTLVGG